MGTGIQTAAEIDRLMDMTDPELVYLLFDTGHLVCAGVDPQALLRKYVHRVRHVHLKDVRADVLKSAQQNGWSFLNAVREGMFTVPGDGSIDFAPLFAMLEDAGYRGWMVVEAEQDPAKANPFEYAVKARKYIRAQTGL
jgi:inosose dehydratase